MWPLLLVFVFATVSLCSDDVSHAAASNLPIIVMTFEVVYSSWPRPHKTHALLVGTERTRRNWDEMDRERMECERSGVYLHKWRLRTENWLKWDEVKRFQCVFCGPTVKANGNVKKENTNEICICLCHDLLFVQFFWLHSCPSSPWEDIDRQFYVRVFIVQVVWMVFVHFPFFRLEMNEMVSRLEHSKHTHQHGRGDQSFEHFTLLFVSWVQCVATRNGHAPQSKRRTYLNVQTFDLTHSSVWSVKKLFDPIDFIMLPTLWPSFCWNGRARLIGNSDFLLLLILI